MSICVHNSRRAVMSKCSSAKCMGCQHDLECALVKQMYVILYLDYHGAANDLNDSK